MPQVHTRICPKCGWIELLPNLTGAVCPICSQMLIETEIDIMADFPNLNKSIQELQKRYTKNSSEFSQEMWDERIKVETNAKTKRKAENKINDNNNLQICPKCGSMFDYHAEKCLYCKTMTIDTGLKYAEWKKLSEKAKRQKKRELLEKICYYNPLFSHADWMNCSLARGKTDTPFGSFITSDYVDAQELLSAKCPFCGSAEIQYINSNGLFAKCILDDPKRKFCLQCKRVIK